MTRTTFPPTTFNLMCDCHKINWANVANHRIEEVRGAWSPVTTLSSVRGNLTF